MGFMLETGFDSVSLVLMILNTFLAFNFIFYNICNNFFFNFLLTKRRLKDFRMIKFDDLNLLFLFVQYINDGGCILVDFLREEII